MAPAPFWGRSGPFCKAGEPDPTVLSAFSQYSAAFMPRIAENKPTELYQIDFANISWNAAKAQGGGTPKKRAGAPGRESGLVQ
jgi:hypothetical protein